ncbi:MAG TPA: ABC transporter permease [Acetobacteraceae bacterium]|jgi:lipopolysaccharide transport system permease protein
MSAAPHSGATGVETVDLFPGQSRAARRRMALRDLGEAMTMWRLCWTLSWLDIRLRYRGSLLGPFWLTLSTGVMVGAIGVIYAGLFQQDMHNYLPFVAVSQVLWGYLSALVGDGCVGFTSAEGMIRSIRMPFSLYSARAVVRNLLVLGHNVLVIIVVFAVFGTWPGVHVFLALPGLVVWLIDSWAVAILLGTLCARFRDIPPIVGSIMQIAFFATPVIWPPENLHNHQWVLLYNPFYALLEIVRGPLLGTTPHQSVYIMAALTSVVLCGACWTLFARVRGRIAFWV